MRRSISRTILLLFIFCVFTTPVHAAVNQVLRGAGRTLFSVVEIPKSIVQQSTRSFPLGIVTGTVQGTYRAVAGTVSGVVDMAVGAAPYAKYLIFFI